MPQACNSTRRRSPSSRSDGFTLIEMVLVIVILGILATIVLVAVQSLETTSSITACKSDYKIVETAQEAYRGQTGAYATSVNDFLTTQPGLSGGTVGPWLKELPASNRGYQIGVAANGSITVSSTSPAHGPDPGNADCAYA
jgi:prepilin-type N-terminal cleavage/methylation domain-containing protein